MKKNINPQAIEIQKRFFDALDYVIASGEIAGLQTFCNLYGLSRVKYSNIRTELRNPNTAKATNYKIIDLDAPVYISRDFGISLDWLMLGRGKMLMN